jgi:hypothetical protein
MYELAGCSHTNSTLVCEEPAREHRGSAADASRGRALDHRSSSEIPGQRSADGGPQGVRALRVEDTDAALGVVDDRAANARLQRCRNAADERDETTDLKASRDRPLSFSPVQAGREDSVSAEQ